MNSKAAPIDKIALLQALIGVFLVSFSPVFAKLSTVGPAVEGVYRMIFGGITLLFMALATRTPLTIKLRSLKYSLLAAVFFTGDLFLWQKSINIIGPGLATMLLNCQVFIFAIVGAFLYHEEVTIKTLVAYPLALIGLMLLVGFHWHSFSHQHTVGIADGFIAAFFYAGYVMTLRKAQEKRANTKPMINLLYITLGTGVLLSILGIFNHESFVIPDSQNWIWLIAYGVICQAFAWLLIATGLKKIPLSLTGFILLLQPALAFIWDIIIFHRPTTQHEVAGAALTLYAIFLSNKRNKPT